MTIFLKLGGSLLTDKRKPELPRADVIERLAAEIAAARKARPKSKLLIGHGSGSFGHLYAKQYGTRLGVRTRREWVGFAQTADAAARLNRIVVAALLQAGIAAWGIQPGATICCRDGRIVAGPGQSVRLALARDIQPVIYGDAVLDETLGGTIASTEEIFEWLAQHIRPERMILVGEVDGIYTSDPLLDPAAERIPAITPETFASIAHGLGGSHGVDVTGGMAAKVQQVVDLAAKYPGLDVTICGGLIPGNLERALVDVDQSVGTHIYSTHIYK